MNRCAVTEDLIRYEAEQERRVLAAERSQEAEDVVLAQMLSVQVGGGLIDGRGWVSDALSEAMTADDLKSLTHYIATSQDEKTGKLIRGLVERYVRNSDAFARNVEREMQVES